MKPCSCVSSCRGQSGLAAGYVCVGENHRIYDQLMQLPAGKTCNDCRHSARCFGLGYSTPNRTSCDFYPNRFMPTERVELAADQPTP